MSSGEPQRKVRIHEFEFGLPLRWIHFQDGARLVFQSEAGLELIASGAEVLSLRPSNATHEEILTEVLRNALRAVAKAAQHLELRTTSDLAEAAQGGLRRWLIRSTSLDERVLFEQGVFLGTYSVLILTVEAPNSAENSQLAKSLFDGVVLIPKPTSN